MDIKTYNDRELSFVPRILIRCTILFLIYFVLSMIDLSIGIYNNNRYKININNTCSRIQQNLSSYGYKLSEKCTFIKENPDNKTSEIIYRINKNGNITQTEIELYYDANNYNDNELRYILDSLNTDFSDMEIDSFIYAVNKSVNDSFTYKLLKNKKYILRISLSGNYVNIHNR